MNLIYKNPFILYGGVDNFKISLDFIKYKGNLVMLCITELSTGIEKNLIVDLRMIEMTFYFDSIRANIKMDELEIIFVIRKNDVFVNIDFHLNSHQELPFESRFRAYSSVLLKKLKDL